MEDVHAGMGIALSHYVALAIDLENALMTVSEANLGGVVVGLNLAVSLGWEDAEPTDQSGLGDALAAPFLDGDFIDSVLDPVEQKSDTWCQDMAEGGEEG
jgi:hypothetical protein